MSEPTSASGESSDRAEADGQTQAAPGRTGREAARLLGAARRLAAAVDAELIEARVELTMRQAAVLGVLVESGPVSVARIAVAAGTTPQAVGGVLFTLQERGLVDRRRHPPELPVATAAGRAAYQRAAAVLARHDAATPVVRERLRRLADQAQALAADLAHSRTPADEAADSRRATPT